MFREQLMQALDSAVKQFNHGLADNDAVIKAAADAHFNPQQTQRLVETYNTAKSIYFFKVAADRRESFPLADAAVVVPALFSGAKAEAKAAGTKLPDYSFYETREYHYDGKWGADDNGCRQAPAEPPLQKVATDLSLDTLHRSLKKHAATNRQTAQRCLDTAGACEAKHIEALRKLAAYVSQDYQEPARLAAVEHYMWSLHGHDLAEPVVLDLLAALPPAYTEKRASVRLERLPSDFDTRHPEEAFLVKEAFEARFAVSQMRALADTFNKEAAAMLREWEQIVGLGPAPPKEDMSSFFAPTLPEQLKKQAAPQSPLWQLGVPAGYQPAPLHSRGHKGGNQPITVINKTVGGGGGGGGQKPPKEKSEPRESFVSKALTGGLGEVGGATTEALKPSLSKAMAAVMAGGAPEEEKKLTNTLRNMQRQLILEDLITNDPVLSGEDPQAVIAAYHTLINMAPEVSLNKEVARSVIRTAANAVSFSPFDAKNISELEGEIRKNLGIGQERAEGRR